MAPRDDQPWNGSLILAAGSMLDVDAEVLLDVAAATGFDGIGLRLSGEHRLDDPAAFGRTATDKNMIVHDAEVYRISTEANDPGPLIEATAAVGCGRLLVVSDLDSRNETLRSVADLVVRCAGFGITVALEYMAWTNPSTPTGAVEVASETGCVVLVDLLHHVRVEAGLDDLDAIVASGTLGWVQLCDGPAVPPVGLGADHLISEARHHRAPPGQGELPLATMLERFPRDVTVSVEVQSDELSTMAPLDRAELLHDSARRVLDRIV